MTLVRLAEILGDNIEAVNSLNVTEDVSSDLIKATYGKAEAVARLAKQLINNADVVLRRDKLMAEGKLSKEDTISTLVGE